MEKVTLYLQILLIDNDVLDTKKYHNILNSVCVIFSTSINILYYDAMASQPGYQIFKASSKFKHACPIQFREKFFKKDKKM